MENSIIYKEKYLKYKIDYLNLKNQIYKGGKKGGKKGKNKLETEFVTHYCLFIVLDLSSYKALKRKVLHNDLSIDYISKELLACGLKITENSDEIKFLNPDNKAGDFTRAIRRMSGSIIDVRIPEYKLKDSNKNNIVAKMDAPYSLGSIYTHGEFIQVLSDIITKNLVRKTKDITDLYADIPIDKAFAGTMLFRFSTNTCEFVEAYTLNTAQEEQTDSQNQSDIEDGIISKMIATLGDGKFKLNKDNTCVNPKYRFVTILSK